jgi:SAM-dependent methyltransferase
MTHKEIDLMRPRDTYDRILEQRKLDGQKFFDQYRSKLIEVDCPACGGSSRFAFEKYGFGHRQCEKCRTLFCSPRPPDELLTIFYNQYEAPRLWTELLLKTDNERKALQSKPRVEKMIALMQSNDKAGGRVALDIGAGSGAYSLALKNSGFFREVIAMDLSADCVKVCRELGLNSRLGTVSEVETASVDFICLNDLIEHLFDPLAFLRECLRVLRPKGYISIATPNGEGFDFKILKEQTKNITPPEHLNYFNPYSMGAILERAGFEVVSVETPGILDVDIILREKKAGFPLKDKNEYLAYLLDQEGPVLKEFQKYLASNKLSSHMLAMAKKRGEGK